MTLPATPSSQPACRSIAGLPEAFHPTFRSSIWSKNLGCSNLLSITYRRVIDNKYVKRPTVDFPVPISGNLAGFDRLSLFEVRLCPFQNPHPALAMAFCRLRHPAKARLPHFHHSTGSRPPRPLVLQTVNVAPLKFPAHH